MRSLEFAGNGKNEPDKKAGFDHFPDSLGYLCLGPEARAAAVSDRLNELQGLLTSSVLRSEQPGEVIQHQRRQGLESSSKQRKLIEQIIHLTSAGHYSSLLTYLDPTESRFSRDNL